MAWTQNDLTALENAIKEGVDLVKYDTKTVQYRSLDDMLKLRDLIRKELGLICSEPQRRLSSVSKGLCE